MVASDRTFTNSFLVVTGLTALLFVAGVILLPGLGTYTDEVRAQATRVEMEAPALTHHLEYRHAAAGGNSAVPPSNTVYNYVQIYQP